ncbi:MAG: hypothetical protein ACREQI_02890 [Candidatus Binataceae bacterium]
MSKRISLHCAAVEQAACLLAAVREFAVDAEQVEDGLICILGLENPVDLLEHDWTPEEIVQTLKDFNFSALKPKVLATVGLETSIVPEGTQRRLDETRIKMKGEVWEVHRCDADPFPSAPHAHNYESGHKMHLGTGVLYLEKKIVGKISRQNLIDFRRQLEARKIDLPCLSV